MKLTRRDIAHLAISHNHAHMIHSMVEYVSNGVFCVSLLGECRCLAILVMTSCCAATVVTATFESIAATKITKDS
jgi:hypothetical protein